MMRLSKALEELIMCAENIVLKPMTLASFPPPAFFDLVGLIQLGDQKPAADKRTTRAAMVMIPAIENFYADPRSDYRWQMVIGNLLPLLRIDAFQQFQNERDSLKSEASR